MGHYHCRNSDIVTQRLNNLTTKRGIIRMVVKKKRGRPAKVRAVKSVKSDVMETQWIPIIPRKSRADSGRPVTVKTYLKDKIKSVTFTFADFLCEELGWQHKDRIMFSYDKHNPKKFMLVKNETGYRLAKSKGSKSMTCNFVLPFDIEAPQTFNASYKIYRNQLLVTVE